MDESSAPIGRYASINGLDYYYETHGSGAPLILLHGGVSPDSFGPNLPVLAAGRQVIAVHLQGHGHTRDSEQPFSVERWADDIAGLVAQLGLAQADLLGYSMGGAVALQTAIRHPGLVRKLVVVSAAMSHAGRFPEVRAAFAAMAGQAAQIGGQVARSPLAERYPAVAWERLFAKLGAMVAQDYDWSAAVAGLPMPALLIFADADCIHPEHMVSFFQLLGGGQRDAGLDGSLRPASRLAIIPGATHYDILTTPLPGQLAAAFLDAAG